MPVFDQSFSLSIPVRIGYLDVIFYITESLYAIGDECVIYMHNHDGYELRYIASGDAAPLVGGSVCRAKAGTLILIRPFEYHCQTRDSIDPGLSQYSLQFAVKKPPDLKAGAADVQRRAYSALQKLLRNIRIEQDGGQTQLGCFKWLTDELYQRKSGYVGNIKAVCTMLFTGMLRIYGDIPSGIFPAEELTYNANWRYAIEVFFRSQYMYDVKLQDLADAMKVSSRQISRIMRRMFGLTFTQRLTEIRLIQVTYQLTYTDKQVSQISRECGYRNYNYFSACFRKEFGMTPTEYRVETRKNPALSEEKKPEPEPEAYLVSGELPILR